ncbi:hypothetical protein CLF_105723 [Clonorchis sinensis]|uniref:Uncharacterized protein n=1 Tax=Clonorchis sinensis TaxID=79923 RepID=G7YE27_CLOSI|nr:hypothetical protein CLF_105723 [Clonorchis sinensis]
MNVTKGHLSFNTTYKVHGSSEQSAIRFAHLGAQSTLSTLVHVSKPSVNVCQPPHNRLNHTTYSSWIIIVYSLEHNQCDSNKGDDSYDNSAACERDRGNQWSGQLQAYRLSSVEFLTLFRCHICTRCVRLHTTDTSSIPSSTMSGFTYRTGLCQEDAFRSLLETDLFGSGPPEVAEKENMRAKTMLDSCNELLRSEEVLTCKLEQHQQQQQQQRHRASASDLEGLPMSFKTEISFEVPTDRIDPAEHQDESIWTEDGKEAMDHLHSNPITVRIESLSSARLAIEELAVQQFNIKS